ASSTIISVVDTIMISPLGTQALAATSVTTSVLIIFYSGLYEITSVAGVLIAQAYGARNFEDISTHIRSGLLLAILAGFVATAAMLAALPLLDLMGQPEETIQVLTPYWIAMSFALLPYSTLPSM
ncbi:MAG: MATE family efflux transporter, partial [Chloroflexota bacterium]